MREALRLDREGQSADAIAAYQRLLAQRPALPDVWYNLGLLQRKVGDFDAALNSYQEALGHNVRQPEQVHLNRAVVYSDCLLQYPSAERELERALSLNPGYLPALLNLANLHEDLGRRDLAAQTYERILSLVPDSAQALARYAGLKKFSSANDPLIVRLRRVLENGRLDAAERADVEFSLGRALDDCGAYDAAFEVYRAANRDSRASAGRNFSAYDRGVEERFIDRLIQAFPDAAAPASAGAKAYALPSAQPCPRPTFICGMFRSGSTLLEQLLAGHPRVSAGGELNYLPNMVAAQLTPFPDSMSARSSEELEALAAGYLTRLLETFPDDENIIDKRPGNFIYIGLIKRLFPQARILHTTREALDNCLSIYFLHLDQSLTYALDLPDIGHHYLQYRRLMAHWKSLYGADILDVNYDALVKEPRPVIKQALDFLGLEWDERCLTVPRAGRAIKTASVWQAREPIYQHSSGRAQNYAEHIRGLRDYLAR